MDIKVLNYFLTVAREESISKAAQALHMTQPPLSRQIKELEDELGIKLFIRGRKITLTEEGRILQKRAKEIIELTNKTKEEILFSHKNLKGNIYIGCGETYAVRIIAKAMKNISKHNDIKFHITSGNSNDIREKLDKGLLDFALFIEPVDVKQYNYIKLPYHDTWGILAKKDSEIASKKYITKEDLKKLPLIISSQQIVKNEFSGFISDEFESLNIKATYNLLYNASLMVMEDMGYALCLDKIIEETTENNLTFIPLKPKMEVGVVLAWRKQEIFTNIKEKFLQEIEKEINKIKMEI